LLSDSIRSLSTQSDASDPRYFSDGVWVSGRDDCFRCNIGPGVAAAAVAANGSGYWLVASDGGVFSFGVAFYGSMGATRINKPITAMVGSTAGSGYLLVGADGGVFAFGDMAFQGSLGSSPPPAPITAAAATSRF
jgi:hypothetical protein